MSSPILPPPSGRLAKDLKGVWWLETREDWTKEGERRIDPILGSDPLGIVTYSGTHFAAQFMKRDRSKPSTIVSSGQNNTIAVGGYDAYFGVYEVDEETGKVQHTLLGSLTPSNTGISVSRDLRVDGDRLVLQLETTTIEGEPVLRTLTWKRLS
jgi:hypothetical protein